MEIITEMKVRKITPNELGALHGSRLREIDLGCCIRACITCGHDYDVCHPYTCINYRMIDGEDIEIHTCYEGLEHEFEDMVASFNEQIPTQIFDRLKWEHVDCGDYWSINPSSYYCF